MIADYYTLSDVLAIASVHPLYSETTYPPTREELPSTLANVRKSGKDLRLSSFPLSGKDELYKRIARLTIDQDPRNGYRNETYVSITGGGSGGIPMVFATDSVETRRQRAVIGSFVHSCGILGPGDWVMTMHVTGHLYRALDLMSEIFEGSGATALCAGPEMPQDKIIKAISQYRVNAIAGDAGQVIQLVRYIAGLPDEQKRPLQTQITKALYTSEAMTPAQRKFVKSIIPGIEISSVIGSAEAGPWAASAAELTESAMAEDYADFIYDDRLMHVEILPFSIKADPNSQTPAVPDGEQGLLVQTSLQRLRNPLVRYICGDVASLQPLPESIKARLAPEAAAHYRIVRVYGRDPRISFDWWGEYFDFPNVQSILKTESWGVLQYQIIRRFQTAPVPDHQGLEVELEVRLLRDSEAANKTSEDELTKKIRQFFKVFDFNEELWTLKYLSDYSGFMKSATGRKVMNFVDLTRG